MDTHIPEGMRPLLHPHRRNVQAAGDGAGALVVDRDRSLGRAAALPAKAARRGTAMLHTLRKVLRLKG